MQNMFTCFMQPPLIGLFERRLIVNPFEQFELYAADGILVCPFVEYTTPTSSYTSIVIIFLLSIAWTCSTGARKSTLNGWVFRLVTVSRAVIRTNIQTPRQQFFPVLFFLFFFIFTANMLGMLPLSTTLTSSLVTTLLLALFHYTSANIIGAARCGWETSVLFLPRGLPLLISLLLVVIELLSYIARGVSLSIRLFANMFAGHVLLKLIGTLASTALLFSPLVTAAAVIGAVPIVALELLVAFLQAYVFTLLTALYINEPAASYENH